MITYMHVNDSNGWVAIFDRLAPQGAWIVGGVLLKALRHSIKAPNDLDVQFEGSVEDAKALEMLLRDHGVPANVRSLAAPGASDMLGFSAGWRRAKYRRGMIVTSGPWFWKFVQTGTVTILTGRHDSIKAEKSAQWVLKEYPGTYICFEEA